jgi:hypothetical protein
MSMMSSTLVFCRSGVGFLVGIDLGFRFDQARPCLIARGESERELWGASGADASPSGAQARGEYRRAAEANGNFLGGKEKGPRACAVRAFSRILGPALRPNQ